MTIKSSCAIYKTKELAEKEVKLIEFLRTIPFGQVVIYMENNSPIRIVRVERSVKL